MKQFFISIKNNITNIALQPVYLWRKIRSKFFRYNIQNHEHIPSERRPLAGSVNETHIIAPPMAPPLIPPPPPLILTRIPSSSPDIIPSPPLTN